MLVRSKSTDMAFWYDVRMDIPDLPIEEPDYESVPVSFYIYFADWQEEAAQMLAAILAEREFEVEVIWTEPADKWLVLATYHLDTFPLGFDELVEEMERLAEDNNGVFDGWERPVSDKFLEEEP